MKRALLALALTAPAAAAADGEPWLAPAFTAGAEAMRAAAGAVAAPASADALVLWREVSYAFDGAGRATCRRRWVYRILTPEGLRDWSVSEARWSPWHQERPEIRARVLTPEGGEHRLDAATFMEMPDSGPAGGRPAGGRILWASLPGAAVGAVVEEEIVVHDREPLFAAGASFRELLALPVPIHRGRLVLEAPLGLPLRYGVRRMPGLESSRRIEDGRVRLVFDYRDLPAAGSVEPGLPAYEPRHPQVAFSTGESWNRVARAFAEVVDARAGTSETEALLSQLPARSGAGTELIAEILAAVRGSVRPIPAELGSAGPVPARPRTTIERGAGDALDLATLLVARLRATGIAAYVALLRSGFGRDVEPGLPGLGPFDHAVVYVPAGRPIWIDPSDPFSRVGELPGECQDRLALIASPTARELVRTPAPGSRANRTVATIEITMAEEGPARIVETMELAGEPERIQRRLAAALDAAGRRRGYLDYVRAAYRAEELGEVEETDAADLSVPYRLRLEALRSSRAFTAGAEAAVAIDLRDLLAALPAEFLVRETDPRLGAFVFRQPHVAERRYRIRPPPGMAPRSLPRDETRRLGSGELSRSLRVENGVVEVALRFDSGPRRLTPEGFAAYRGAVQELLREEALVLWFDRVR